MHRVTTEAEMIATGQDAFADGSRVFANLADALRTLHRAIERLQKDATRAATELKAQQSAAAAANQRAATAGEQADLARSQADLADVAGLPSAAVHRDQQLAHRAAATAATQQADDHRRLATNETHALEIAREDAQREVERYRHAAADAAAAFNTIAAVAPHINTVYGRPVIALNTPGAIGRTVPLVTRAPTPPGGHDRRGGNFLDGLKESGKGLLSVAPLIMATRSPRFEDGKRLWRIEENLVSHPVEAGKNAVYRPYTNAFRDGGWDQAAAVGSVDALLLLATGGLGKGAEGAARTANTGREAVTRAAKSVPPDLAGHRAMLDRAGERVGGWGSEIGAVGKHANLGNLAHLADRTAGDVIRSRGGGARQVNMLRSGYGEKSLGELSVLAAQGDHEAVKALKMAKQAGSQGKGGK